jgi:hypothetical protein
MVRHKSKSACLTRDYEIQWSLSLAGDNCHRLSISKTSPLKTMVQVISGYRLSASMLG